jgi:hypothetical protein
MGRRRNRQIDRCGAFQFAILAIFVADSRNRCIVAIDENALLCDTYAIRLTRAAKKS